MKETSAIREGIARLAAEGRVTVRGGEAWAASTLPATAQTTPKYRNKPTASGFASQKEERRFGELALLEMAGKITGLELQVPFELVVNGQLVCRYVCDFLYVDDGKTVVEDVKSPATRKNRAYRIKVKLLKAVHGIDIRET